MKSVFTPPFSRLASIVALGTIIGWFAATPTQAQTIFSDNFDAGASPQWGNQSGNWIASGGVYLAQNLGFINCSALPFNLTNFVVEVDINNVADGGLWLRSDGTGNNGILLVTGGDGWSSGSRIGQAGRALYFHVVTNGSFSPYLSEVTNVFNPTVDNPHIRVEVAGNTFSVFLNGATSPITSLTDTTFSSGLVGLFDNSLQTFDNFSLQEASPSCASPPSGLVGWWKGENNALDSAGTNHGTLAGNTAYGAALVGQGFVFDGDRDAVLVGNPVNLQLQTFTIEAWIKRGSTSLVSVVTGQDGVVFSYGIGGYGFGLNSSGKPLLSKINVDAVTPNIAITDTNLHHVAVTKSGTSVVFYVDGVAYGAPTYSTSYTFSKPAGLGARGDTLGNSFLGSVDEVSVFNRALSAAEIQSIYNADSAGKCVVAVAPFIISQPTNQTVVVGETATFSVTATGTQPLSYQWRFNGTNIAGATTNLLTLMNVQLTNAGTYSVVVSNSADTMPSSNAVLTVNLPACAPPPAGLIGWWRGESNGLDSAGTNHGTLAGNTTYGAARAGQGFVFDGDHDGVQLANQTNLHLQNFTIEAWIQRSNATIASQSVGGGLIFSFGSGGYGLDVDNDGHVYLVKNDGGSSDASISSFQITDTNWHHLAVTKSGTSVVFYLEGVSYPAPAYASIFAFSTPLAIGARGDNLANSFLGRIDEVAVYNHALSGTEIESIYNAGSAGKCSSPPPPTCVPAPDNLVSWWSGESNALDSAGTNNGTLAGNATYGAGRVGQGFVFDGSGDAVLVGNATNLQLQSFTVEAWIKRASTSLVSAITGQDGLVFSFGNGGYGVGLSAAGLPLLSKIDVNSLTSGTPITDTNYHHFAMAKAGTNVVFYVDGVAYPASPYTSVFAFATSAAIGARGDTRGNSFLGSVDEVGVYNRALTTNEIQAIYNVGSLGKCVVPIAPFITTQPTNLTRVVGGTANFNITASGTPPLSYQWSFNGTNISGATSNWLTLANVQVSQSGNYAVVVTNVAGTNTSSNAVLIVNFPPATVRVVSTNAAAASTVVVPVVLVANGNENALGFSLNFASSRLTYASVHLGSGMPVGNLVVNDMQTGSGKLGVELSLTAGSTFPAGTQEVARVTFTTALVTSNTVTSITFGDSPILRQLSDALANPLPATYATGIVTIAAVEYEGDVTPRPAGDRALTITDWVMAGRYAARLDYPTNAGEFQRADCAPRSTLGNGRISVSDWVQAGRYTAGLDPATALGGPTSEAPAPRMALKNLGPNGPGTTRQVQIVNAVLAQNQTDVVRVNLESLGDENALGFSLAFDPAVFSFVGATVGSGANGAALNVNSSQAGSGELGFVLALPAGTSFAAGTREVLKVTLQAAATPTNGNVLAFASEPVPQEVSNAAALELAADYVNGTVTVNPPPSLNITRTDQTIALSWPLWASNFIPQEADVSVSPVGWTNLAVTVGVSNNENVVTLPISGAVKFYRLLSP